MLHIPSWSETGILGESVPVTKCEEASTCMALVLDAQAREVEAMEYGEIIHGFCIYTSCTRSTLDA